MKSKLARVAAIVLLCSMVALPYIAVPYAIYAIAQHFKIDISPIASFVVGSCAVWAWAMALQDIDRDGGWRKASWWLKLAVPLYPVIVWGFIAVASLAQYVFVVACWVLMPFYFLGRWIFKKVTGRDLPTLTERFFPRPVLLERLPYARLFNGRPVYRETLLERTVRYRTAPEIMSEARRRSKNIVKAQIKALGHRISDYDSKTITEYANLYLADHPELIEQATYRERAK